MYIDIPIFRRCCFCFPLRQGLLAWSYIKFVYNILGLAYLGFVLSLMTESPRHYIQPLVIISLLLIASIFDIIFGLIFIISAHMKNWKLMKLYYTYCLVMLVLAILFVIGFLIFIFIRIDVTGGERPLERHIVVDMIWMYGGPTISVCLHAILFIYMVLLVRSEVLKLERNVQCKFVKTLSAYADDDEKVETERAVYNRLSSDAGSVYSQCTISVR